MNHIKWIFTFFLSSFILCQDIPKNSSLYQKSLILFDIGNNWNNNTIFGPIRFHHMDKDSIKSNNHKNSKSFIGLTYNLNSNLELFGYHYVKHNNFFFYIYPRIVTNNTDFERYTGVPRDINRFGFNSGETDLSGVGYQNETLLFQIGRGRENWSAGNDINLILSNDSPSYDYMKFQYNYGKARFVTFHGFLENKNNYNRYITGRGIELTNKKSMVFGFSEIVIYSGLNRPIDFAYINPISTHLEIELNNRQNTLGTENGNAVWQFSNDNLIGKRLRISNNLIIDELVIDKVQLDSGKVNGLGWSSRIAYNLSNSNKVVILYGSLTYVGTHTLRHGNGYNNFVHRNYPLGLKYGSDGYSYKLGLKYYNSENLIFRTELGEMLIGSNSIIDDQYREYLNDYKKTSFPSGKVDNTYFVDNFLQWDYKPKLTFLFTSKYSINKIANDNFKFQISIIKIL